jgi:gliding motility-associated-like protein
VATTDVDAGPDQTICSGETAILSASGGTSYTWSNGDQGATIQVSPTETTTYIVTATGVCIPVDSVIVFVTPETEIFLTQPAPVCSGEYIEITASGGELYIWASSPPDGTLNFQNTNAVIHVKPNVTTIYSVTGSIYGCTGSAHITAEIYPSPTASFIIEPPVVSSFNPIVNFLDNSSGLPISWYWDFGDQNYSVIQHPTHTYSDSGGVFPVTLIITNVHGCIDSITQNVIVRPDHVLYVPNAFTPGSDGINDEIFVLSTGVSEQDFEWIILNRWGKIVFYSNDLNRGWDGRDRGVLAPQGVYTYKLTFRDKANLLHQRYGIITLIR